MSKLYDTREALAQLIIAAGIGWTDDTVLRKRQSDLFNDVATALCTAQHGAILHIGVAEGTPTEDEDLEMEVTLPLTIICEPQLREGQMPEEDLWERLVDFVHDLKLQADAPYLYRFRFRGWTDVDIQPEGGGAAYLGRQTSFAFRLSIDRKIPKPN